MIPVECSQKTEPLRSYWVHIITYDNSLEFAEHGRIKDVLGWKAIFTTPTIAGRKGEWRTSTE
jgi:hypothetical protein